MADSRASVQNLEKVPPHSREAEMSVIGSMLFDENALTLAIEVLKPDYFYETSHSQVFSVLQTLFDRNQPADLVTVSEELRKRGQLEAVGGAAYLTQLTAAVPTAANIQHYAKIVKERALLRMLIQSATTIVQESFDPSQDARNVIDFRREGFPSSRLDGSGGGGPPAKRSELAPR